MHRIWLKHNHAVVLHDISSEGVYLQNVHGGTWISQYMYIYNILKSFYVSTTEAEAGGCFVTGRYVVILSETLEEMGHPYPIEQVFMDKKTASVISNNKIKQQC